MKLSTIALTVLGAGVAYAIFAPKQAFASPSTPPPSRFILDDRSPDAHSYRARVGDLIEVRLSQGRFTEDWGTSIMMVLLPELSPTYDKRTFRVVGPGTYKFTYPGGSAEVIS